MKRIVLALSALACLLAACADSKPQAEDSKSNWLRACSDGSDCGSDLACECGVCTEPCSSARACEAQCPPNAQCSAVSCEDPSSRALASACGTAVGAVGPSVCLLECSRASDCGRAQRCVQGSCVGTVVRDGGVVPVDGGDSGTTPTRDGDGGTTPVRDTGVEPMRRDTGVFEPPIGDDGGDSGTLGCNLSTRPCCAPDRSCDEQLVCHVDRSCIAPGARDEQSIATRESPLLGQGTTIVAADASFVYGVVDGGTAAGSIVRWPVTGGARQTVVRDLVFASRRAALALDGDQLYFIAAERPSDLSKLLMRVPSDGSSAPVSTGTAGSYLVQDATHLYFSNDGDSRVVRLPKASFGTLAAREPVYSTQLDAANSVFALAIAGGKLFVAERTAPGMTLPYAIKQLLTSDSTTTTLATSERFSQLDGEIYMVAGEHFLVLCNGTAERLDLASLEVKPLGTYTGCTMQGDRLIAYFGEMVDDIDLSSGRRESLVLPGLFEQPVIADQSVFGLVSIPRSNPWSGSLVRIVR